MCLYTCQCSSSSSLPLEAFPQVHSAQLKKLRLVNSVYLWFMQLCDCDCVRVFTLTSSSSLKTDASPGFFAGSAGTGSLGF